MVLPQNPRVMCEEFATAYSSASSLIFSFIVGTSGSPIFISSIPDPLSSSAACRKYLPSVQRKAWSFVKRAVPAEPVKPDIHSRNLKWSLTYSEAWSSSDGTRYMSIPASSIALRNASILSVTVMVCYFSCSACPQRRRSLMILKSTSHLPSEMPIGTLSLNVYMRIT